MEIVTKSAEETKALGRKIAVELIITHHPLIIALTGDLGSGKTTFVQGFAEGLGINRRIISPTFILMRCYSINNELSTISNFYHIDLYRLEKNVWEEVRNLGIEDIWSEPKNVVVIEWAEKIADRLPAKTVRIEFQNLGGDRRRITIK